MTNNPTIDGVSRATIEKALSDAEATRARTSPHIAELRALLDAPPAINLDAVGWNAIQQAASESPWMPPEYMRNDWVSDVCAFLRNGRALLDAPAVERQESISPGWPDPLESPQAKAIMNGHFDDTEFRALFDRMEQELRLHRALAASKGVQPEVAALQSTIVQLQARIAELESGRGEPVAWMYKREGSTLGQLVEMESDDLKNIRLGKFYDDGTRYIWPREDYIEWKPLYTALPAPVAVVLPERHIHEHSGCFLTERQHGWNACLDATAALNEGRK